MSEIEDLKKQLALLNQNLLVSKNEINRLEGELYLNKQKLSNSNSKISDFTDAIPFSVFEIYENGQLIFLNKLANEILDNSSEDLIGKNLFDYLTPQVANDIKHNIEIALNTKSKVSSVFKLNGKYFKVITIPSIDSYRIQNSVIIFSEDISTQIESESELNFKTILLGKVYEEAPDGFMIFEFESDKLISCNRKIKEMFELSELNYISDINDFISNARVKPLSKTDKEIIINQVKLYGFFDDEVEYKTIRGNTFWASYSIKLLKLEKEDVFLIRLSDISEIKKINKQLFLDKQKRILQIENSPLGYVEWNENFEVVEWNKSSEKIFGYSKQEATGKSAYFLVDKKLITVLDEYWRDIKSGKIIVEQKVYQNITKDGQIIHVNWFSTALYDTNGKFIGIGCLVENITEQLKNEAEINRQLHEKEILLSEVHHRVKNNLAIISGLLFMQSESVDDPKIKQILTESQSRIKSMAIIHDQLYKSENFSEINIHDYLKELTKKIASSYSSNNKYIDIDIESNNFSMPISQALTIGLIINELVINSYKYAFTNKDSGKIKVRFNKNEKYFFSVGDNGVGFPLNKATESKSSLGMNLIQILVQQLKGEVEFFNDGGAVCKIKF
jgi:PAS domain S-box-containing protein